MKKAIVKAVVLCTLALSLLFMGVVSVGVDTGVEVCHDGEKNIAIIY